LNNKLAYDAIGYCPVCEAETVFRARYSWYRGQLTCAHCGCVPRERALALVLGRLRPDWRQLVIHECSPGPRGISPRLKQQCAGYTGTHYYPDKPFGSAVGAFRNENFERQTFEDNSFDIVVSLDVMEHLFNVEAAYKEVFRTLKPGGLYLHTFPIQKDQVEALIPRAALNAETGAVEHLKEAQFHGNPISGEGALVTFDFGYDVHKAIATWAQFEVEVIRFADARHGILGEFTEVFVCRKPSLTGLQTAESEAVVSAPVS
jgi:SAM-dependent methyltransferase